MKLEDIKQGINALRDSVVDGWSRLREAAATSLTRFNPNETSNLPSTHDVDDNFYFPSTSWGLLSGNVYEDDSKIVVRLEIPGLDKDDFRIEVSENILLVSGEKRFEREQGEGRYRTFQCAYGAFQRRVPLPAPVVADSATAAYRNGILRVELPKAEHAKPKRIDVRID